MAVANAGDKVTCVCDWKGQKATMLQEREVFTLLQKLTKMLDGWVLFEEWVKEIDKKFAFEGRKVALVINNCTVHP